MNKPTLTDEECLRFRQMPCSFNDMVRAIYDAGIKYEKDRLLNEILINQVGSCNHDFERIIYNE
jgi:hypothetical protein